MRGAMCAVVNVANPPCGMSRGTSARVVSTRAPDAAARALGVSRPSAVSSVTSREVGEDARGGTPRVLSDGYKRALAMWRAGAIDAAIEDFEAHLADEPLDAQAWLSYAQMVKRPRVDAGEQPIPGPNPNDVLVSRESVARARRVLRRAADACDDPRALQALGIMELTYGVEVYGAALLERAVGERRELRPVLLWRRFIDARRRVTAAAGAARMARVREGVRARRERKWACG